MTANQHRYPEMPIRNLPWVTSEQMRRIDQIAVEKFGLQLIQMMENAGRAVAELGVGLFQPRSAVVVAGSGGNGGGGLAAARHLHNRGVNVEVCYLSSKTGLSKEAAAQAGILSAMDIAIVHDVKPSELLIDAIFGYGLNRTPDGRAKSLIEQINDVSTQVLALDVPSGLDATTGGAPGVVVWADATVTLALPKRGLAGAEQVGDLYLADISIAAAVYERAGIPTARPDFEQSQIVRLV